MRKASFIPALCLLTLLFVAIAVVSFKIFQPGSAVASNHAEALNIPSGGDLLWDVFSRHLTFFIGLK